MPVPNVFSSIAVHHAKINKVFFWRFTEHEITPRHPMEEQNDCKIQYIWRSNYRSTFNHIELYKDKSLE